MGATGDDSRLPKLNLPWLIFFKYMKEIFGVLDSNILIQNRRWNAEQPSATLDP